MPDARFWADSKADYRARCRGPGPLAHSLKRRIGRRFRRRLAQWINGCRKTPGLRGGHRRQHRRADGALHFCRSALRAALHKAYTEVTAADVFEAGGSTGESFVNSWPLREFIAKQITPQLIADVAAAHRAGRRLFVVTTDLDSQRSVVWNMGAIAVHGGADATKLFSAVLLASASVPGGFPPVLIDVEAYGKRFQEMHVDGGLGGQFFVAPAALMQSTSQYRLPATKLYIVVNTSMQRDFKVVDRFAPTILTQSIGMAVPVDTSLMIDRLYIVAKRNGIDFNIASIPASFNFPAKGPFDPAYMKALYLVGYRTRTKRDRVQQ